MKNKNILIVGAVIFLAFALMFFFRPSSDRQNFDLPSEAPTPSEILEDDQSKGNPDSSVVIVEYSDFECPACAAYFPLLSQLTEQYGEEILFVYRHFPLPQHTNAHLAARASEAAGLQGSFWQMHDLIFEGQRSWITRPARTIFLSYAESLGLDMDKFRKDLDSEEVIEKVQRDTLSGLEAGVSGTPSFFVNGEKIDNPGTLEAFVAIIEEAGKDLDSEEL